MRRLAAIAATWLVSLPGGSVHPAADPPKEKLYLEPISVKVPHIATDKTVVYDYDIVYVRAKRAGDEVHKRYYSDFSAPITIEPGADLMLLRPDGSEEVLVEGGDGAIIDPMVSFDGQWVYYTRLHNMKNANQWDPPREGGDITSPCQEQENRPAHQPEIYAQYWAADWSSDFRKQEPSKSYIGPGVYNMGPCPPPGGKVAFTSNRDGFRPAKGYPAVALQLFVMDDRDESIGDDELPQNLDKIGHLTSLKHCTRSS